MLMNRLYTLNSFSSQLYFNNNANSIIPFDVIKIILMNIYKKYNILDHEIDNKLYLLLIL